jgi:hypothetical protein
MFRRRAAALGITCTPDTVVLGAARTGAGSVAVTLLHHPTGRETVRTYDAVVVATPPRPREGANRIGDALAPRRVGAAIADAERLVAGLALGNTALGNTALGNTALVETDGSAVGGLGNSTVVGLGG